MTGDMLQVDPVALHLGCNDAFGAVGEAAMKFQGHEDGWLRPCRAGSVHRRPHPVSWQPTGRSHSHRLPGSVQTARGGEELVRSTDGSASPRAAAIPLPYRYRLMRGFLAYVRRVASRSTVSCFLVATSRDTTADAGLKSTMANVRALPETQLEPAVEIPRNFVINEVPVKPGKAPPTATDSPPPLGPLEKFKGTFIGQGFNTIFRPQNATSPTELPNPQPDSDNVLELNLTIESLSFSSDLNSVPNRGSVQTDVILTGVPYLQTITDVTDPKRNTPIHLEPGLWLITPETEHPAESKTVARLASIPHGTTVNAQGTFSTIQKGPEIRTVDITPFPIGNPARPIRFDSQTVTNTKEARIPQDLSKAPRITQTLLDDPNSLLREHIKDMTIIATDILEISTQHPTIPGGGTANIGFLVGDNAGQNAEAVEMSAIFWIETVEVELQVGPLKPGEQAPISLKVPATTPAPSFVVSSKTGTKSTQTVTQTYTQIQYTQTVLLNFATLTWPHVSVATLAPDPASPILVELG
jgi:hypothetical protein